MSEEKTIWLDGVRHWVVYKITNPSGRYYIGLTTNFKRRMRNYNNQPCKSQKVIKRSLDKYGFKNHKVEILDEFDSDKNYAFGKEMFYIRSYMSNASKYKDCNGYMGMNLTNGGEGTLGSVRSQEAIQKWREKVIGRKRPDVTERFNKIRGGELIVPAIRQSLEHRKKISNALKGKKKPPRTEEHQKKIDAHKFGRKLPTEQVECIRERMIGNKFALGKKWKEEDRESRLKHITKAKEASKKTVLVYGIDGTYISEYPSCRDAANDLNVNYKCISLVVRGINKSSKGFVFKLKDKVA